MVRGGRQGGAGSFEGFADARALDEMARDCWSCSRWPPPRCAPAGPPQRRAALTHHSPRPPTICSSTKAQHLQRHRCPTPPSPASCQQSAHLRRLVAKHPLDSAFHRLPANCAAPRGQRLRLRAGHLPPRDGRHLRAAGAAAPAHRRLLGLPHLRTNSAYARFWEARCIWGQVMARAALAISATTFVAPRAPEQGQEPSSGATYPGAGARANPSRTSPRAPARSRCASASTSIAAASRKRPLDDDDDDNFYSLQLANQRAKPTGWSTPSATCAASCARRCRSRTRGTRLASQHLELHAALRPRRRHRLDGDRADVHDHLLDALRHRGCRPPDRAALLSHRGQPGRVRRLAPRRRACRRRRAPDRLHQRAECSTD